jgi:putative oxidoreductase
LHRQYFVERCFPTPEKTRITQLPILSSINKVESLLTKLVPASFASLALRVALAVPFYRSGLTKWDGFGQLSESAVFLFEDEFKLHVFGKLIDYPMPTAVAYGAGIAEIVLPILLVLGIGTRFAALGLLLMTALIQITVPDGWPLHLTWAAMAMGIIALGAGKLSLDGVLGRSR